MTLLIVLTVLEILALVLVLFTMVNIVITRLKSIASTLAKVSFGVRAVETQVTALGPALDRVNATAGNIAAALPGIAEKAERAAAR